MCISWRNVQPPDSYPVRILYYPRYSEITGAHPSSCYCLTCLDSWFVPREATSTSRMGEKLLTFLMRRLYMDRSGAFPQIFGRKITFKDRLHGTYKVYGYHVLASAMDTTRLCLTLTPLVSFVVQQIYVYKRCFKVNQHCSSVGSRTRTIILSLGTYPASLLYSE
jgi:hypothetical protein